MFYVRCYGGHGRPQCSSFGREARPVILGQVVENWGNCGWIPGVGSWNDGKDQVQCKCRSGTHSRQRDFCVKILEIARSGDSHL